MPIPAITESSLSISSMKLYTLQGFGGHWCVWQLLFGLACPLAQENVSLTAYLCLEWR